MRLTLALCLLPACSYGAPSATPAVPPPSPDRLRILAARGGAELPFARIAARLGDADAICIGESHDQREHHELQHQLTAMVLDATTDKHAVALGLEMVGKPFQGVLDDYARGAITEPELLDRVAWKERWGYDFAFYRPTIDEVRHAGGTLLALNAPRELTHEVAQGGLAALSAAERARLPQLDLANAAHRAWFDKATEGHAGMGQAVENFYVAQVIWDETMADTAATWLEAVPGRKLVILAGTGHCIDSAIPARLRRRGVAKVISIRPVVDDGSNIADALAAPEGDYLATIPPDQAPP
jgi:uncharacterized iron-regulated protein